MSYPARGPGAPHGAPSGNRGGSVRAARLRAEQGEPLHHHGPPPPPPSSRPPPPNMSPQWPLSESEPSAPPRARGPPPQRPPRPRYVPSILDPTKQSDRLGPPGQDPASPGDGELLSPYFATRDPNRMTGNSVNSSSSLGSIPDFPVPNAPRKPPALGPPPSARRGPSSYYSQISYVSPIVEEAESHRSHNSFASSNVIPANAGDFYFDDDASDDDEDLGSPTERGDSDDGRSRPSDDGDQSGLVRQASMGKRGKPSLTTIKSMESMDKLRERDKNGHGVAMPAAAAIPVGLAVSKKPSGDELRGGTGLIPPSPSTSSSGSKGSGNSPLSKEMLDDGLDSPIDPRVDEILGGLEKGGLSGFGKETRAPSKLSDRVGTRRPPKLNVDALHEAESRGSLTSLPDLIRRATRLASNLDRGKTASRLGFDLWELGGPNAEEKRAALAAAARKSDNASLADMLTSFPRPATASPQRSPPRSPYGTHWPTGLAKEQHYDDDQVPPKKRGKRCCGMPRKAFIIFMIIIALLAIAAVVVSVVLTQIVFKNNDSSNASQQKSVSGCAASLPCSNGGTSMLDPTGSCACICANGYTGASCTQAPDSGCTTTNMGGSSNATIGSAVPELITKSQSSFQIPLNGTQLLALFSKANMSCSAENALVTFSGLSKKARRGLDWPAQIELFLDDEEENVAKPAPAPVPLSNNAPDAVEREAAARPLVTPLARLQRRQYSSDQAKTNLGIVYDANGGSSMYSATSTVTSSPTSSTTTPSSTSTSGISAKRLAFCQTGVLYIFQASSSLDHAVAAQENLQTYFTEYVAGGQAAMSATAVSLGNGWTIDLTGWTVKDARGVSVGNTGGGATSNG
ncbi:uncharacterized protein BKA78DRAFT_33990 [Phyllosticta capitalensis]|uniref:uncharacterized protein n=1 Tax=Phyllosticta capitalensis TaxID=121624 RepID=UPI00312E0817